ncbi:FAD-linked oxidase C-terminal domain-containing protein [Brevibacterium daeguense]|uniref:FAD-linked oxidase C-terminal domain-containing protein n=1 Tax=Brevibacterium daeguense TaxID=909936 RepID=A0ABP8EKS5_9MICO|nr:FAD-linked oxidase C-terminal domain-containing protein [Brevibacterium daeguense]
MYPNLSEAATALDLAPLEAELSPGALVTEPDVVAAHSTDRALFCAVGTARGLVRAVTVEDVQATLRFAHEHRVPVVPQGARTGLSGAANAVDGALLLSVAKLDRVLEVDTVEMTCTVEPGILNQDLKDHLKSFRLAYPPDPGSVAISTIGGNVATNAGGLCCVKYGVTRDYVRSLTVVLADGRITTVGRPTAKGVAGFDLSQLFIGSEGSLGVIVGITLELVPELPEAITAIALFPDVVSASGAVTDFMATGARPSLLEFLDRQSLRMLNAYGDFGLPADSGAMLLAQSNGDGSPEAAVRELESFTEVARACGADEVMFSDDPNDSDLLIAARRAVSPAAEKYAMAHGGGELIDDVCVPRGRLREFFARVVEIGERHQDIVVSTAGHAGDGNMHPTVFFDASDPGSVARAQQVFDEIMAAGLELGGTITGEHGVGYLKREWLARELDPVSRELHMSVKRALDPHGILNPGKMLAAL